MVQTFLQGGRSFRIDKVMYIGNSVTAPVGFLPWSTSRHYRSEAPASHLPKRRNTTGGQAAAVLAMVAGPSFNQRAPLVNTLSPRILPGNTVTFHFFCGDSRVSIEKQVKVWAKLVQSPLSTSRKPTRESMLGGSSTQCGRSLWSWPMSTMAVVYHPLVSSLTFCQLRLTIMKHYQWPLLIIYLSIY